MPWFYSELQKLQVVYRWPWTYEMIRSGPGPWRWSFFIVLKRLSVGLPSVIIWNQKMWISCLYDGTYDQYSFVVRTGQRGASNGILWIILRMLTPSWSTHPPILSLFYFLEISIFTGKWKLQLAYLLVFTEVWRKFIMINIVIVYLNKQNRHIVIGSRPADVTFMPTVASGVQSCWL